MDYQLKQKSLESDKLSAGFTNSTPEQMNHKIQTVPSNPNIAPI